MNSLEPNQLLPFRPSKREGVYTGKSTAELQMIIADATKWKDTKTLEAVKEEMNARNGVKKQETVQAVKALEKAVTPKKRVTKLSKAKLP